MKCKAHHWDIEYVAFKTVLPWDTFTYFYILFLCTCFIYITTKLIIMIKGKGYMKTYWLKGKKDLSFKTPAELRYSSEQKDSEDRSSNG